jgi:hypothetical protein
LCSFKSIEATPHGRLDITVAGVLTLIDGSAYTLLTVVAGFPPPGPLNMSQFASRHWPVAILLLGYAWVCSTLIPVSVDDIRMADVFSVDESGAAAELRYFFITGRLERASFKYGSLFYYVPLAFLHLFSLFADVTDRVILIVLRSYGAFSGAGCLVVVYLLGHRLSDVGDIVRVPEVEC